MSNFLQRLMLFFTSSFSDALTSRGAALAARGRSVQSFRLMAKAARSGGAKAQFEVGRAYLRGDAVPASPPDALFWLERSATAGYPDAQYLLACLAVRGIARLAEANWFEAAKSDAEDHEADYESARFWARKAAGNGSADAKALLACLYNFGPIDWRDEGEALVLDREAAAADCAQGRLGVAVSLLANGSESDLAEARRELTLAAEAGLPAAHLMLGSLDERSDPEAAAEHYRIAAEAGLTVAKLRYGKALFEGCGVARDAVTGEGWLRRAALEGEAEAACLVAEIYLGGDGAPANFAEAAIWLRRAAEIGDAAAARRLGHLCLKLDNVAEAVGWLEVAAEAGDVSAKLDLARLALAHQATEPAGLRDWLAERGDHGDSAAVYNLGICCAEGIGGARDDAEALSRFRESADEVPAARYWIGRMEIEGRGAQKDLDSGRSWVERAAHDGVVEAQLLAAEMMVNGRGGDRDVRGAFEVFTRLAAAGHPGAQFSLGVLKAGGHGIEADAAAALGHFRAAARQGHPRAALMTGRYLAHGIGGPINRIEAGDWLRRARVSHRDEAEQELVRLLEMA